MNPLNWPEVIYFRAMLGVRIERARNAPSRGASAVEWVIITAIIAGVAMGLALAIQNLVKNKQAEIEKGFGGGGNGGNGGNP
ncbi:hypothetical protein [Thermoactinospora rubra]|uniref:hypothetical protein n=1 Tax=Thermoactinospora rubra TaxID=1088767 RepID=UPI000A118BE6|nr:hypothetical protein [Thermoactinospora rubra]